MSEILNVNYDNLDYSNMQECLKSVIELLECASSIMVRAVHMPFVEPDDPVWNDYWKEPYVQEMTDVFSKVFDAQKFTKQTLETIKATQSA